MPKAIISNRIYFRLQDHADRSVVKALTYRIEQRRGQFVSVELIKNYEILKTGVISIPQGRFDLIPEGYEIEDKRITNEVPFPVPKIPLRPEQQEIYDKIDSSCFLNAKVGWGKTFTALYLARKFGQKTLVVTHTTLLRDQWIEEAKALFGMDIGVIGASKFDIEDHAIVVGNIQSVVKVIPKIEKEFGTIILDEAHHVPATTFRNVLDKMHAKYRIGLSGTTDRKDGKQILFKDYFGPIVLRPVASNTLNPTIKIVKTGRRLGNKGSWADEINALLYDEEYQNFVSVLALAHIELGHKVLIAADRVEFLKAVKDKIGEDCILITGELKDFQERQRLLSEIEAGTKTCVAGSRQIFSEGISVNPLSCLIMASPISNTILLEQLIGRIQRMHPGKLLPIAIDLQFEGVGRKQNSVRKGFYVSKGWKVETYE